MRRSVWPDDGFTLTELVIVISLVGVLAVAVAAVFSVIVRTLPSAEARTDEAHSLLGLSTWLPSDVSSTPFAPLATPAPAWDREPSTTSGCAGMSPGVNVLRLRWTESFGTAATESIFIASYRYVDTGSGWKIMRYYCTNGGAPSVGSMTGLLPPIDPAAWTRGTSPIWVTWQVNGPNIVGATIEVATIKGGRIRVDGGSNNPSATLPPPGAVVLAPTTTLAPESPTTLAPPTTVAVTTIPPVTSVGDPPTTTAASTTTIAATTTTAPTPTTIECIASITSVAPNPVKNQTSPSALHDVETTPIIDPVIVVVQKSGNCANLGLEYKPILTGVAKWLPFGGSLQVVLPAEAIEPWDDGSHALTLRNGQSGGPIVAVATLVVM